MLELSNVSVRYGETPAVDGVSLTVAPQERLALLGPSGSGKSTLLRAIAGLEPLYSGDLSWQGRDLAGVPVHERRFGLMFQDYVLFPQRSVSGNVRFGLEMRGDSRAEAERRVDEVLDLVGLAGYGRRRITELSGGEQQRVALARALAPTPRLLMLDEPLGALDRALRGALLDDLAALFERLELPIIYVTHDQEEALAIGDRVAVMRAGSLEAVAPPHELWHSPPTEFVARFLGFANLSSYARTGPHAAATDWGTVALPAGAPDSGRLLLRPDALTISHEGQIAGVVRTAQFRGDHVRVIVDTAPRGAPLQIDLRGESPPQAGDRVLLAVDASQVVVLG